MLMKHTEYQLSPSPLSLSLSQINIRFESPRELAETRSGASRLKHLIDPYPNINMQPDRQERQRRL